MPYSYIDVQRLKGSSGLNLGTGTVHDVTLRQLGENVSQEITRYCGDRHFQARVDTLTFDGPSPRSAAPGAATPSTLHVPDLISVTSLLEDSNMDGTYNVTWGSNDYVLYPQNAQPTSEWGRAYNRIVVSHKSNGTQDEFLSGQQRYQIVGTWGYQYVTVDSGLTGTLADATATSITFSGQVGSTIAAGHMLEIGTTNEFVYVTSVANTTATAANVRRAQMNTTGTLVTAATVSVFSYPGPITEAAFIQTARLWRRKDSAFASEVGFAPSGQMITFRGLDQDIKELLAPYRRRAV